MSGLSPKLPLVIDSVDGAYGLNKTYEELVAQNLKCLILTNPGEKMMDPTFGVGIKRFLFEQNDQSTYSDISAKIREQVAKYMPFININDIIFNGSQEDSTLDTNSVTIKVLYNILPLDVNDMLSVNVDF